MIKKVLTIVITVFVCILVVGGLLWVVSASTNGEYTSQVKEIDNINELKEIDVETSSGNVSLNVNSEEKIKVVYSENEKFTYEVTYTDGKLNITRVTKGVVFLFINLNRESVEIYLPASLLNTNIINCDIESSSGEIKIMADLMLDKVELDTSSGDIVIDEANINDLDANSSSGSIDIIDSSITKIQVSETSGNITIEDCVFKSETVVAKTSSGKCKIINCDFETCNITTSSGDVEVKISEISPEEIKVNTSSGKVKVYISEEAGYKANFYSSSGRFSSEFGNSNFYGNEKVRCEITTSSGDFKIYRK